MPLENSGGAFNTSNRFMLNTIPSKDTYILPLPPGEGWGEGTPIRPLIILNKHNQTHYFVFRAMFSRSLSLTRRFAPPSPGRRGELDQLPQLKSKLCLLGIYKITVALSFKKQAEPLITL